MPKARKADAIVEVHEDKEPIMADEEDVSKQQPAKKKAGCCGMGGKDADEKAKPEVKEVAITRILGLVPDAYWMMAVGGLCSAIAGIQFPAFSVVFGNLFNVFFDSTLTPDQYQTKTAHAALMFFGIGCGAFIVTYVSTTLWVIVGERVVRKLRALFFEAVLRQEVGFFDATQSGQLISRLSADVVIIQAGVSEKLAQGIQFTTQILGGIVVAFIYGWKMTLVMLACSPLMMFAGALSARIMAGKARRGQQDFALANDVASESITGVRTVYSFVAEEKMSTRYWRLLQDAYKAGVSRAHLQGAGLGFSMLFMFSVYALGFWYGGKLILDREMKAGDVITVFFSIVMGAMGIGQLGQVMPDIAKAKGTASVVFDTIDRVPQIDPKVSTGVCQGAAKDGTLIGRVKLRKVDFEYPQRPGVKVMKKFSVDIKPGQTVALVGPSGSGKSTIVQLLQRFYDVTGGVVEIDGVDVREYDLKWLRSQIGLVSQEPTLFSGTVSENIRFGKDNATEDEVIAAAKLANAHNFVSELKDGYNTQVGERGVQLSGGQKQRIAIARAVLKNPKILLLDEATSALDAESEHLVQEALDKLMKDRTTIVVAHRLTTVRDADKICVVHLGKLVEKGTHEELIALNGKYAALVKRQLEGKPLSLET